MWTFFYNVTIHIYENPVESLIIRFCTKLTDYCIASIKFIINNLFLLLI